MARLIRRVALRDVRAQQREVGAVVDVGRDRRQVRLGLIGLLDEAQEAVVRAELDDAVLADEVWVRLLVDGDRASVLRLPPLDVLGQAGVDEP